MSRCTLFALVLVFGGSSLAVGDAVDESAPGTRASNAPALSREARSRERPVASRDISCSLDPDCDDGQYCNGPETCNQSTSTCQAGSPPSCDDGDGGTIDYCDPTGGLCGHVPAFDPTDGTVTDSMWPSGLELGGIGVGKLEVRTNGEIGHYTINNNWDKWVERTKGTFFAVFVDNDITSDTVVLRRNYSGGSEYAGLQGIDHVRYSGMFPRLTIDYFDMLPVALRLSAFSPLIPQNPADSSLPIAFFTFEVTNESSKNVDIAIAFSLESILGRGGYDTWSHGSQTWNSVNGNYQESVDLGTLQGVKFRTTQDHGDVRDNSVGEYLILAVKDPGLNITTHNSWNALSTTPSFWTEFSSNGTLTDPASPPSGADGTYVPAGVVAAKASLAPFEARQFHFLLVWFMPTHITVGDGIDNGHAYLNNPATDTGEEIAAYANLNRSALLSETSEWQDLVLSSNLPFWLKLRMLNGLFTMFANTVYTQGAHFYTHESLISMRGSLGTIDQRMCFHPFYTMLFPQLDQDELTTFGDVRPGDGRVSHFNGNVGWKLHSSDVGYGVTDWPDLSCSYVMQVLKSYKWTGDMTFLDSNWTEVQEVMSWLENKDSDGDYIPEGGSTYDYEGTNPGAFVYTASAYLGALKAAEEMARIKGDTTLADSYAARFADARNTVMSNLWTGAYFRKYYRVSDGATTSNSFIASLAGDWLSRYSTTGRTLDVDVTKSAESHILNWHQDLFADAVAPMEVAPDGSDPADNCYQYQHEPYIGMESIYDGYVDEGLQILYSIYRDHWERAGWPWNGRIHPSIYGSGKTGGWNGDYYMSNPATWGVLNALSGTSIDVPNQTLYLAPRLPTGWSELHIPVFFPKFWGWLDFDHTSGLVELEIVKTFGSPITITKTVAELASGSVVENTTQGLPFTASVGAILTYNIPVDNTAPAAVGDLAANWTGSDVELTWTAPGDDGASGRALRYDIRYSLSPIDAASWDDATSATREPYPVTAGTQEVFTVLDSLSLSTTYYFAMKSKDEESNWSALSNVDDVFTGGPVCTTDDDCSDGAYCTGQEYCDAQQQCQPGSPVDCSYLDDGCNAIGVCNEIQDQCEADTNTEGMSCDDGAFCNGDDTCDSNGICQPGTDPCTADEFCNETQDTCCSGANGSVLAATFPTTMPTGTTATPSFVPLPTGSSVVDYVDIGDPGCEIGHNMLVLCPGNHPGTGDCFDGSGDSWGPIVTWGGESDGGRAVWENGTAGLTSTSATLTLDFGSATTNKYVAIRWLDGQASDAFDMTISGHATTYILDDDPGDTQIWQNLGVWDVGPLTGSRTVTLTATSPAWSGQEAYGQVTLSEIAVYRSGCTGDPDCDDSLWCNGAETCVADVCQAGTAPNCDDGVACTDDSCNEGTDSCDNTPNNANCDDSLYCNGAETCDAVSNCQSGTPPDCDDGVACTDDSCNEGTDSCDNTPNDANCDDGQYCNGAETCDAVSNCQSGTPPDCDDAVACTNDTCNESTDSCDNTPDDANCDDGIYCNGAETCDALSGCQSGSEECLVNEFCNEDGDTCCSGANGSILTATFPTTMPTGTTATPSFAPLPAGATLVDYVEIGDPGCEIGHNMLVLCSGNHPGTGDCFDGSGDSWGPIVTWGGESDGGRAVWENGTAGLTSKSATLTMDFGTAAVNKYVAIRWLDGQASDAFDMTISGHATTYTLDDDPGTTEIWEDLGAWNVGAITGVRTITLTATSPAWSGQETYGQVSLSEIAVYRSGCAGDPDCDDGEWCNGLETCSAGVCQAGSAPNCDDGVTCTDDSCNEGTDSCDNTPNDANCADGDPCTIDSCDPVLDCEYTPQTLVSVDATVQLVGVAGPVTRCIQFTPRTAGACGASISVDVQFSEGPAVGAASFDVECNDWTELCAKDEQHSLSNAVTLTLQGGVYETASTLMLGGGDTDGDGDVDINDATYLIYIFDSLAVDGNCPWDGTRDADFSNNGVVWTEDYTFLAQNWLAYDAECQCGSRTGTQFSGESTSLRDSVVAEAKISVMDSPLPFEIAKAADLNDDDVLDYRDIRAFEDLYGLDHSLSSKMKRLDEESPPPTTENVKGEVRTRGR